MSFLKREKSLAEIEEETEHTDAEVGLLEKKLQRKILEEQLGKGAINRFKSEGDSNDTALKKAWAWFKKN